MIRGASWSFFSSILLCFSTSVFAQDLYKCVSPQGTTYQSHPCAAKTAQKTACMGSISNGFEHDCRKSELQRQRTTENERNAYTQDSALNKTKVAIDQSSEFQRGIVQFPECKQRIDTLRLARYAGRQMQIIENSRQMYAARICTAEGSIYMSCNAITNTLLTQKSSTCPFKRT